MPGWFLLKAIVSTVRKYKYMNIHTLNRLAMTNRPVSHYDLEGGKSDVTGSLFLFGSLVLLS